MKNRFVLLTAVLAMSGCALPFRDNCPPADRLMHPGPGVDGPGPGVMTWAPPVAPPIVATSQVAFVGPEGMMVAWDVSMPGAFDSEPLVVPGRYNFTQGAMYRLKLTNVPGRPGVELYPTLEVAVATPRTAAYLDHNAIPFQLTEEDFDQVLTGNFVTKVIYLPDAEYQELALAGVETLVSTRLDPGVDPVVEADRRGTIMAIIRIGNKDLEVPTGDGGGGVVAPDGSYTGGPGAGGVMPVGYCPPGGCAPGAGGAMGGPMPAMGAGGPMAAAVPPPGFVAGVTAPQYGMPITGTPIGLPGPPHIPLGIPAGLQKHVIKNHTFEKIPGPTRKVKIHVQQEPGFVYPQPASHAFIDEHAHPPLLPTGQNWWQKHFGPRSAGGGAMASDCGPGACPPQ